MKCTADIQKYNALIQKYQIYVFLDGLDDQLDAIQSDILKIKPFLMVQQAYAYV